MARKHGEAFQAGRHKEANKAYTRLKRLLAKLQSDPELGSSLLGGGAFLVITGAVETTTVVGSFLALHQVPVGVFMGALGLVVVGAGGYLVYDSITRP